MPVAPENSSVRHLGEDLPHVALVKASARRTGGPAVSTRAHRPERPPEDRPPSRKSCSLDVSLPSRAPTSLQGNESFILFFCICIEGQFDRNYGLYVEVQLELCSWNLT
jgi:hypothetical protein